MNFARAVLSFTLLILFSVYVFLNAQTLDGSYGIELLMLCIPVFGVLLVISGNLGNFLLWRIPTILIATFFIYFATKLYIETNYSSFMVRRLMIGTNGGVLFAFFTGLLVSQALSAIYDLRNDTRSDAAIYLMTTAYVLFVLGLAMLVFMEHRGGVRLDVFKTEEAENYQRVGDLLAMQFLALSSLVCVIVATSKRKGLNFALVPTSLLFAICGVYALTSQLLGSNKGAVVPAGVLLVYLAVVFAGSSHRQRTRRTSILNILFSGMVFKLLFASLISLGIFTLFGQTLLQVLGLEASMFRITGFGTGEVTSIDSRSGLFKEVFWLHFMHSPIFGHTQVEFLTGTGEGTYVHSTLSILTHLGVVGFVMFLGLLLSIYLEISNSFRAKHSSIYGNQTYGLFRLLCLFAVLVMGLFSAFFTWIPLWFAFGLFGNWYHQSRERSQRIDAGDSPGRRRRRQKSLLSAEQR